MEDLKQRGLLDSTVVLCMGEFGRTPRINGDAGRDHLARAWSVVLGGGGIKGGRAIGKTNADGTGVDTDPYSSEDLMATRVPGARHLAQDRLHCEERPPDENRRRRPRDSRSVRLICTAMLRRLADNFIHGSNRPARTCHPDRRSRMNGARVLSSRHSKTKASKPR